MPLDFEYRETPLHETIAELIRQGRAPIYLVNFTQRAAAEEAQNLMSVDFSSQGGEGGHQAGADGRALRQPYGKELQRFLRHGIGLHHAGLLPKYRLLVERLAQKGLLKVVSGTDTLGVGVNIPIRTVLFTQLCKYDGEKDVHAVACASFKQIAGRAGRKGFDDAGQGGGPGARARHREHEAGGQGGHGQEGRTSKKPPDKGYVHFDKGTFERLSRRLPEPLESRFDVSHGLLLTLLQGEKGDPAPGRRLPAAGASSSSRSRRAAVSKRRN